MRVNHNIASMTALRHLGNTNQATERNLQRLSSGMRINSGADGPAELVISEQMRAQVTGLNQAVKNSETGISMVQTAEGALNEVSSILINMRQLTLHAANEGANDEKMLQADQNEMENLLSTLDRIAKNTQF
jgi:flagellin